MDSSPVRPSVGSSAPAPTRLRSAGLASLIGWPAVALLGCGYLLLIARLTSFPFEDFPDHLARAEVLSDLLFHHGARFGWEFTFHWQPVPYLLHDLVLSSCVALFGTRAGGVLFTELVVLSLPCALLYYMRVNGLAPRARPLVLLVSLYLSTDWFFIVGFTAFRLAIAFVVLLLALADRLRQRWTARAYGLYIGVLVAGYLVHLTAVAFFAATLTLSAAVRLFFGRTQVRDEVRLGLPVAALLLLYFGVLSHPHHPASPGVYSLSWGSVGQKLRGLEDEFYRFGGRSVGPMMALLGASLIWPIHRELRWRRLIEPAVLEALALALAFLALYFVLPATYSGAAYVDVRALPMVVLFALLAVLALSPRDSAGAQFASAPALALAGTLAALNLAYIGWHLEQDNTWMARYRAVDAAIPRGARVLPIYTVMQTSVQPFIHASAFVLLDRAGRIPFIFSGDQGDPMSYFRFRHRPYAPVEQWYILQSIWSRDPSFTFHDHGQTYRWRFRWSRREQDWKPAILPAVDWRRIACEYPYIIVTRPFDPAFIGVPTRTLESNRSAALLAVDRSACGPERPGAPPSQVTY
jgi:hypothetical protein